MSTSYVEWNAAKLTWTKNIFREIYLKYLQSPFHIVSYLILVVISPVQSHGLKSVTPENLTWKMRCPEWYIFKLLNDMGNEMSYLAWDVMLLVSLVPSMIATSSNFS